MRHISAVLLFAATISFTGCGQFGGSFGSSPRGGIAVVDLEKVAAETGRDRQLAQSLEMAQNSLNQSYAKTVESAKTQLDAKKKEYGESLSESEQKEFSAMERNAVSKLTQIQNKVRQDFEGYKQKQIMQFRAELKPVAQEIAAKRGLAIVIPKNEGLLLSVDPGVDITDDVIKVMRERHPVNTSAPAADAAPQTNTAQKSSGSAPKKPQSAAKSTGSNRSAESSNEESSFR